MTQFGTRCPVPGPVPRSAAVPKPPAAATPRRGRAAEGGGPCRRGRRCQPGATPRGAAPLQPGCVPSPEEPLHGTQHFLPCWHSALLQKGPGAEPQLSPRAGGVLELPGARGRGGALGGARAGAAGAAAVGFLSKHVKFWIYSSCTQEQVTSLHVVAVAQAPARVSCRGLWGSRLGTPSNRRPKALSAWRWLWLRSFRDGLPREDECPGGSRPGDAGTGTGGQGWGGR